MLFHDSSAIPPVNKDIVTGLLRKIVTVTKSKKKIEEKIGKRMGNCTGPKTLNTNFQFQNYLIVTQI